MQFYALLALASTVLSAVSADLAPLKTAKDAIPGSYIVKLNPTSRSTIETHLESVKALFTERSNENGIETVYKNIGNVYHAKLSSSVLEKVRGLPDVEYIEQDAISKINVVQTNAPWGLARTSSRAKLTSATQSRYTYTADGSGVSVYVIDTGILTTHPEFEGRARFGAKFAGTNNNDEHGHGTHCAGTIGSKTYGVAKKASLVGVKVCDAQGQCPNSAIISGVNWAVGDKKGTKGNVISMSLGGGYSAAINSAVSSAYQKGFVTVVAAGNDNQDACNVSPASTPNAITVAASDINDTRASFSNFGSCVDVFGPGVNVLSTWNNGGTNSISGTSMATPHVAGLAAYFLSQSTSTNAQVVSKIIDSATKNAISGPNGSPNLLIYNNAV